MNNKEYEWDSTTAHDLTPEEGQQLMHSVLMTAAGDAPTIEEAVHRLTQQTENTNETEESISISLSHSLLQKIDTLATSLGIKRNDIIKQALTQQLA
ncbi:ribbon-helix-helix protein, CopG family [Alloscardovia omnicolens]|uniref:ribbon-helix-helix protein, CopG family n=1 Tax=Alloscardovia omnicolens TaxID=419015 RepID=UPI00254FB6DA|nr:ribbon-helix-helix protein, CopG family [Alloscardovia omnicolens]MDK8650012.1 ribbon-helix-helix protein, CopG family [Alloscardovia omnicolens]